MNRNIKDKEECLEQLWYLQEEGLDSMDDLKKLMGHEFCINLIEEMAANGKIRLDNSGANITLTEEGRKHASRLIRSHRLAERLVYDVLGGEFEAGACEFEHIANPGLVDSICTMLGHPRECPHGMPIPEGSCCEGSLRSAESSVASLTELEIGQTARVAYINCRDDRRLHKLDSLQIRPGSSVKLHQTSPTIVIECEGANIALDESVCADIRIWKTHADGQPLALQEKVEQQKRKKGGGVFNLNMLRRNRLFSQRK